MIKLKFESWVFKLPFLSKRGAICIGRTIHLRLKKDIGLLEILAHELVHQHQITGLGIPGFYWEYFKQWVGYGFSYTAILLEKEAYENWEDNLTKAAELINCADE